MTDNFKSALMQLEKLQEFKKPLTKFFDQVIYSNEESHEALCEFYILQSSSEEYKNIDLEIETVAHKLARLLELKENELKQTIIKNR